MNGGLNKLRCKAEIFKICWDFVVIKVSLLMTEVSSIVIKLMTIVIPQLMTIVIKCHQILPCTTERHKLSHFVPDSLVQDSPLGFVILGQPYFKVRFDENGAPISSYVKPLIKISKLTMATTISTAEYAKSNVINPIKLNSFPNANTLTNTNWKTNYILIFWEISLLELTTNKYPQTIISSDFCVS